MKTYKILVLSDNETWETLNDNITIAEVTEEGYNNLCNGWEPSHLEKHHIIRIQSLKEQ